MRLLIKFILVVAFAAGGSFAHAYTSPGSPSGYVNDFANVLSEPVESQLQEILRQYAASTTNEIAVATVRSLDGDYIENFAEKLFQEWGVGTSKEDNGVLLLLATEDRELRIEVGYGLEGAIPDSVADRIIRDDMIPALKENNYDGAVTAGVGRIMEAARGEYAAIDTSVSSTTDWSGFIEPVFIFGLFILQWLWAILARTKSWWLGGVFGLGLGAVVSSIFGWWLFSGLAFTSLLIFLGLLFDYIVSNTYQKSQLKNTSPPWWAGGSSGGFGGRGGGGFGGFGGGRSGGGGASGRW